MGLLDFLQNNQQAEGQKQLIRDLRMKTKAAGAYFPDAPVTLNEAMQFAKPVIESQTIKERAAAQLDEKQKLEQSEFDAQKGRFSNAPSLPLTPSLLLKSVLEGAARMGRPLNQEQMGGIIQGATRPEQGGVGEFRPFAEKPGLLSLPIPTARMTTEQEGQYFQRGMMGPEARQEQDTLKLAKERKESAPPQADSIEKIIAQKVLNGEMKLDDAIAMKNSSKPTQTAEALKKKVVEGGIESLTPEEKQVWDQTISKAGNEIQLDPTSLDYAATIYRTTGQLPNFGFGNAAAKVRTQVLQRAAQQADSEGGAQGDLTARAGYKAGTSELSGIQKQRGLILSFEDTAQRNMDLSLQLSKKVDRTGSPLLNRWLNASKRELINDPDLAQFDAAVNTAANEYARVVNTATGGGVNTDSARAEAHKILNTAQSPEAFEAVIKTLRQDMENRRLGYESQISRVKGDLSGKSTPSANSPKSALKQKYGLE